MSALSRWADRMRRKYRPYPGELPHEHDWRPVPGFYTCGVKGCHDKRGRT